MSDFSLLKVRMGEKRREENYANARKFKTILRGIDHGFTKLRTDFEKDQLQSLYKPKRRRMPEPLILPDDAQCKQIILRGLA